MVEHGAVAEQDMGGTGIIGRRMSGGCMAHGAWREEGNNE